MAETNPIRCLILACGNSLRSDDGVGPWLAAWAEERFRAQTDIRIISEHQWTPDLAADLAHADSVLFVDSSAAARPGAIQLLRVTPAQDQKGLSTHHLGASQLLALCAQLYGAMPRNSLLLTIGIGSTDFREAFSDPVQAALPQACALIEKIVSNCDVSAADSVSLKL